MTTASPLDALRASLVGGSHTPTPSGLKPVRTAAQRLSDARHQPDIFPLAGEIWMSGELHILFADAGVGKSILAVALANALTKGQSILGLKNGTLEQPVLFYDFELSDKQFEKRYTDDLGQHPHPFSPYFFIDNIDWFELDKAYAGATEEGLFKKITHDLIQTQAKVLVIDNLTFLHTQATEKTEVSLNLMRRLIELKRGYGLSILVLAHTPKVPPGEPLHLNHLAGSKMISNFADSVSALGKSVQGSDIRYWKQVKPSRSAEIRYDASNVLGMRLVKDQSLLTFEWYRYGEEREHLQKPNEAEREKLDKQQQARDLKAEGKSIRDIAEQLGVPSSTVGRWVKE